MTTNKYANSIIYKIVCKDESITDCYVGSTTNFRMRVFQHKSNCNRPNCKEYNFTLYDFIRCNGGWDNWKVIEIEKYPCNNLRELHIKERYWFDYLSATLNCAIPTRSHKQWKIDNIEHLKIKEAQNRDKDLERQRYYNKYLRSTKYFTCECGTEIQEKSKQYHLTSTKHTKLMEKLNQLK